MSWSVAEVESYRVYTNLILFLLKKETFKSHGYPIKSFPNILSFPDSLCSIDSFKLSIIEYVQSWIECKGRVHVGPPFLDSLSLCYNLPS
jgi:hypothetical protein